MLYQIDADQCQAQPNRVIVTLGRTPTVARPVVEPLPYNDFSIFGDSQKDIEGSFAENILGGLLADQHVMPIFETWQRHNMADIYALNVQGDLVIYELRRVAAAEGLAHHSLTYAQRADKWDYTTLERKYRSWSGRTNASLAPDHAEAFGLEEHLRTGEFNRAQHLMVIAGAADEELASAIAYWKRKGVSVEFLPYRVYTIAGQHYFELFSPPYDRHFNASLTKGVLFDTSRDYNEAAIYRMMECSAIEAYGDKKQCVCRLSPGDIVFYSHKRQGIVAAAKVKPGDLRHPDEDTFARDVEFLTVVPCSGKPIKAMPLTKVEEVTGKRFSSNRTMQVPWLSRIEAWELLEELRVFLAEPKQTVQA